MSNKTVEELRQILAEHKEKRICVIGTTCVGKTTFMKEIPEAVAMSDLMPLLTDEGRILLYKLPVTQEVNEFAAKRGKQAKIEVGHPAFGTVLAGNAELIVYLAIDDELLLERTKLRGVQISDAKTMQAFIEEEIKRSGLPVITVLVTK